MPDIPISSGGENNKEPVLIAFRRRTFALLLLIASPVLAEEDLPLWEVGLGVGAVRFPDYRGADEGRTYVLPTPYVIYRGGRFRVDRRGARGELYETDRVSVNITGNLGPPSRSDKNETRVGMPDLDPAFEIGPSVNVRLYESAAEDTLLSLRLPLRAAVATNFRHAEHIGWVFLPHLAMDFLNTGPGRGWNFGVSAGPIYGSNEYHDYYYTVAPEYATPTRPAYDASGGYSGFSMAFTISKRYPSYWVGTFIRYDDLHGAAFEDSPLVRSKHYVAVGIAISKIFARSEKRVGTRDTEHEP